MSGKQGYIAEHRIVMEKAIGRFLKYGEVVHHKDGDRRNNTIENLELCESAGQHTLKYHREVIEQAAKQNKGKRLSPETEFKKGATPWNKGRPLPFTVWNKGKPWNEEVKRKISEISKGRHYSPRTEFRKGLVPWNKGRPWSKEMREKMRVATIRRFQNH